jgi:hypothetical protein
MTTLFTRSLLKGMSDGLSDGGAMAPFANDDFATGVFDKVAADLGLPDIIDEHLPNEAYIKIGQVLLKCAKVAQANGIVPDGDTQALSKVAAANVALSDRALNAALFYMDKAAEEASLNGTGINTPESAAATNAIARLDQANRSSLQYLVGMGNTDMPEGGVIGRQMAHPMAPQGPAIMNSLTNLDKMAAAEELAAEDAELTPEELAQIQAMQEETGEKVGTALMFMSGLANRGAPVTGKTVLASAILANSGSTGLQVMADIVGNTKTAEELDHHLDEVVEAGGEEGVDPHLVEAIKEVLEDEAAEQHAEKAAGASAKPFVDSAERFGKDVYESGKGLVEKKLKGVAKNTMRKFRKSTGTQTNREKLREKLEDVRDKAKKKLEEIGNMPAKDVAKAAKKPAAVAAGIGAAGLAGHAIGSRDDDEKDAALLDFLKAAADGSLNEVEENTPEDAAHYNANAELDMDNRSPDEYLEGAGESEMPNVGHRGASMAAPKGPARVNPDNTATRETKSAAFDYKVKAAAQFWGPKLPATMSQNEKRAHVIALAGMPADLQPGYVGSLYSR